MRVWGARRAVGQSSVRSLQRRRTVGQSLHLMRILGWRKKFVQSSMLWEFRGARRTVGQSSMLWEFREEGQFDIPPCYENSEKKDSLTFLHVMRIQRRRTVWHSSMLWEFRGARSTVGQSSMSWEFREEGGQLDSPLCYENSEKEEDSWTVLYVMRIQRRRRTVGQSSMLWEFREGGGQLDNPPCYDNSEEGGQLESPSILWEFREAGGHFRMAGLMGKGKTIAEPASKKKASASVPCRISMSPSCSYFPVLHTHIWACIITPA